MNTRMKKRRVILFGLFFLFAIPHLRAQYTLTGILKDSLSGERIPFGTVMLYRQTPDSLQLVTGAIADSTGYFSVEKVPAGKYRVRMASLGYLPKEMATELMAGAKERAYGEMGLQPGIKALGEVVVTGKLVELKADRKVIHVDKAHVGGGENVPDVLQVLPEIRVTTDNKITLKERPFTIFLNGKPSSITADELFQMPASTIERLEVITNPSVKYTPEGLGGIINIVTKRRRLGVNGVVQANMATDRTFKTAYTFNYGVKKFNFFSTLYVQSEAGHTDAYSITDRVGQSVLREVMKKERGYRTDNFKIGFDYDLTVSDLLTFYVAQQFRHGIKNQDIVSEMNDLTNAATRIGNQRVDASYFNRYYDFSFNYKHIFSRKGQELSVDMLQSVSNDADFSRIRLEGEQPEGVGNPFAFNQKVKDAPTHLRAEFSTPLNEGGNIRLEVGSEVAFSNSRYRYYGDRYDPASGSWRDSAELRSAFRFGAYTLSPYALFSGSAGRWNYAVGGRFEYYKRTMTVKGERYPYDRCDFFYSLSAGYNLNESNSFNFALSRRTDRPIAFYLDPTVRRGDYVTEKIVGDPDMKPSFAHSFDLGYAFNKGKFSVNTNLSYMTSKDELDLTFYQEGNIRYKTFANDARARTFMGNASLLWNGSVFSATLAGTVYRNFITRERAAGRVKTKDFQYDIRFIPKLKLKKVCDLMIQAMYYGPSTYPDYKYSDSFRASASASRTFHENWVVSVRYNNFIFKKRKEYRWDEQFRSTLFEDMHLTSFTVGILYKFGRRIQTRARTNLNTNMLNLAR